MYCNNYFIIIMATLYVNNNMIWYKHLMGKVLIKLAIKNYLCMGHPIHQAYFSYRPRLYCKRQLDYHIAQNFDYRKLWRIKTFFGRK